jgi:rare lipoprotein A
MGLFAISACKHDQGDDSNTKNIDKSSKQTVVKQQGLASWYGDNFQGKKTASGEIFDQNEMTAASKTLPLGTTAKVTNIETGKSVTVKVNDRGPYVGNRVMDLSKAAAQKIDLKKSGVSKVKIVSHKRSKKRRHR